MDHLDVIRKELLRIAQRDENVYFVCVDGHERITLNDVADVYPERIIRAGISETNAVSVASGLALTGKTVFVIMLDVYATTRALEQLRVDAGYNNANIKIIGSKSGLKYNVKAGYSHWAIEDIANVRSIPNISIVSPATIDELKFQLDYASKTKGPFLIRIGNQHSLFNIPLKPEVNNIVTIQEGKDVALIAEGCMVEYAANLLKPLRKAGIRAALLDVSTIKPFNRKKIHELIDKKVPMVTLEEQTYGGISSIVSEVIAEYGKAVRFLPIRISNENYNVVGNYEYVANQLMNLSNVPNNILKLINKKWGFWGFPIVTLNPSFKINPSFKKGLIARRVYKLFNILPILEIKQRRKKHRGKPRFKFYLFGFVRII